MIAGLLLAAGMGRRFGAPKLTALLRDEPLVRHAARALLSSSVDHVVVVVGSEATDVRDALRGLDVRFVDNAEYRKGIGTSIAAGVEALTPEHDAALIALGDQPSIPASTFDALIAEWRRGETPIIAARYRGVQANPVLFARAIFPELAALRGDKGARSVIVVRPERVGWVDLDAAIPADVDTRADLDALDGG